METKTTRKLIITSLLAIVALALGAVWMLPEVNDDPSRDVDTSNWSTYKNGDFGFSIKHPSNWEITETNHPTGPMINIYPPNETGAELPFTHHSAVTHVSIFPQGVPTEGVSGEQKETTVDFQVDVNKARDYTLSDGEVFATYANLGTIADGWNDSGFIFSNVTISNLETECFRDGEPVSDEQCDVLTGDMLVRHGTVNSEVRAIQKAMLESFERMDEDQNSVITHKDLIRVTQPTSGEPVSSPLTITGEARGMWYFEASFPVRIEDADGNVLGEHYATAQGEWMTEEYVPFSSELTFNTPTTETGMVILEKDNPSGLSENADKVEIPVQFSTNPQTNERNVLLYYYNPEEDIDENNNILCSDAGLVPVERTIPITETPIQDTIRLLLSGRVTDTETEQGIETEYPLDAFSLTGANLDNGVLTLNFSDPNNTTSGGSCRTGILWHQIRATAEQFDEVDEVRFQPEELFQP